MELYLAVMLMLAVVTSLAAAAGEDSDRERSDPPAIRSSWDDLLEGVGNVQDWRRHREVLRQRFLDLIRDAHKPAKPPLDVEVHERDRPVAVPSGSRPRPHRRAGALPRGPRHDLPGRVRCACEGRGLQLRSVVLPAQPQG